MPRPSKKQPKKAKPATKRAAKKTGNKKKKKKAPATAFRRIIQLLNIPIRDSWHLVRNEHYLVFSPFGKEAPADTIGIDVGTKHLGISALDTVPHREHPVWTWVSLVSYPAKNLHSSVDIITDLLLESADFEWMRNCRRYRIELQVMV